jgi:ribosomal-protein-alanine N-acetyltransferase
VELETERLLIRSFRGEDLNGYASIVADPDVMHFLGGPQTIEEAKVYLDEMINLSSTNGLGRYAVALKRDGDLVGFCGFRPAGDYIDLGYRYSKRVWGKGLGLEAAKAVRTYGLNTLNIRNMEAGAAVENQASIRILAKLGFRYREELTFDGSPALRFRDKYEATSADA